MDGQPGKWANFTPAQRRNVVMIGGVTTLWQIMMLWDLYRRPAEQVKGPKPAWVLASFVRPIGQIAYSLWGRQPPPRRPGRWG